MTLTQAIEKRNQYRSNGVGCQIKCISGSNDAAVWEVFIKGIDY